MKKLILVVTMLGLFSTAVGCSRLEGIQGFKGEPGATGASGPQGQSGAQGATGTSCTVTAVPASSPAPNGGSYIQCSDGTGSLVLNGSNGADGTNGSNGADGANGTNGSDGTNGTNGSDGAQGTAGINGTNGTDGTVVTPVKFCPGESSYPSTFVELGFCIDNSLYAVYSANGGFLTEIKPGYWSSNAINSSCSFTVGANCAISY